MDLRALLPRVGDRQAKRAWNELFSREVLGAVMVGTAAGKVVESFVRIVSSGPFARLAAWVVTMMVGIYVFVLWHEIADAAKEKAEAAKETAEEATDP